MYTYKIYFQNGMDGLESSGIFFFYNRLPMSIVLVLKISQQPKLMYIIILYTLLILYSKGIATLLLLFSPQKDDFKAIVETPNSYLFYKSHTQDHTS